VLLDVAADLFDHIGLWIPAQQPRPAAQARSKAGFFSILWMREKPNILAPRTPRRARWPAINASGRNCKNELPIVAPVAADDSLPGLIFTFGADELVRFGACESHCEVFFLSEYGIGSHVWESIVSESHSSDKVGRRQRKGLSESCGQNEFAEPNSWCWFSADSRLRRPLKTVRVP
jgi:hypothetical protein